MTHEVVLQGYNVKPGSLQLGTFDSYGIEKIHVTADDEWAGLDILAVFHAPDGTATKVVVGANGMLAVPPEATAKQAGGGRIVFAGLAENVQRITVDMRYSTKPHSDIKGDNPGTPTPDVVQQILENSNHAVSIATAAQDAAENARQAAEDAAKKAGEGAGGAAASAAAAKKSAEDAAASSKSAASKAEESASSASAAAKNAKAAQTAQGSAENAAQTAADAAGDARQAAGEAAQSAEAAETAKQIAEDAAKKALEAKTGSENALQDAGAAKDAASGYADAAAEKATAAAASEKNAAKSENSAADSAAAAKKSAEDADNTANSIKDSMAQISENKEAVSKLKEDLGDCIRIANYTRLTPVFDKKGLYWSCNPDYKLCVLYANEYKEAKVYEVHKGKRYTVCGMSDGNNTSPLVIFSKTYPTVKGETSSYENFIAGSNSGHTVTTEKHISSPIDGYMLITSSTVYGGYAIEEGVRLIVDDRYGLYVSDGCYTTFSKIGNNTYLCRIFKNVYINQLFDFNGCYIGKFDEYGELYKYKDFGTFPSDVVGPIAIRENDWSATTKFSGGSHGIEISGTNYPTAKQKTLLVKCGNKTIDTDGYYIGQTEFVSKNILYIPMTITGNDLSSAKEGIEETRRYCINDVLSVSVDYNMLTDIIADVLYGFQLQIYGMEEITLPNNEVKVSVNQEQNYVFKKPENKYICTNENGDYCSVEMSTCGLGDFLKNNGESVTKYGYISVFKNPNKIYFQLINHGVQLATGKTLHWDAICNHRPH